MKRIALTILLFTITAPAAAQTVYNPGVASVLTPVYGSGGTSPIYHRDLFLNDGRDTPTMRRQKLDWAIALRDQALRFQAEDGGVISDDHARYIRRRAERLLFR